MRQNAARHGGQILVEALKTQGVSRVFSVPGESFLAALDGLAGSGIVNTVCRHEGGAAMMADAWGKMTGRPGVVFVTRGPGATNASAGLHVARQDSTPLVCFVGQIARDHRDREAFQELDYRQVFGSLVKWVAEVDQTERLPEYVDRAFRLARTGRPGPVVLALPEDMLSARADVADRPAPVLPVQAVPDLAALRDRLSAAERPLVILGGSRWSAPAARAIQGFAEANGLPVATSFRRQDHIDNRSPSYVGDLGVGANPKLAKRLAEADLLLVLGARLTDILTQGFSALDPARPVPGIVHVHPDPDLPGSVFPVAMALSCAPGDVAEALADAALGDWSAHTSAARAEYEAYTTPKKTPGAVKLEQVIRHLSDTLPEDAIVTNGAGNFAAFVHRYYRYKQYGTLLAPTSGSMGYGFPAAVSASLRYPGRQVVCVAGDGDFQMTLNEMSTAMQWGAKPIVIVANNGRYGTIRMHQERHYPGRPSGTDLANPDFAALARAYGAVGLTVTDGAYFPAVLAEARSADTLAVIELKLDPEALSTGLTLAEARALGEAARR